MDTFGFTKKKLERLSIGNQHRHILSWLSRLYQQLATNRINPASLDLFTIQYNQILSWTGMSPFSKPESNQTRLWMEAVSDRIHYHRVASGAKIRDQDLMEKIQIHDLSFPPTSTDLHCHVALDGVRSLFNVGSIFRTCEAAGFTSIILGNTPGKEDPRVQKTAMGTHKWMKQEKTADLAATLMEKKEKGCTIVGIETLKGATAYDEMLWGKNTIVVFGNEEYGISSHVLQVCDEFVHIPMFGKKNSINIANAVSVICFQITRSLTS